MKKTDTKTEYFFWVAVLILAVAFFVLKFAYPVWVERLYAQGHISVMNRLTGAGGRQALGYYLGRMEEAVFGPLSSVLSGIVLILFSLRFLKGSNAKTFFVFVFLYLLITKLEVLLWPPYGDTIGAGFAEGYWLFKHKFDYIGLAHQPNFVQGGPRTYLFTLYPGYLALLMLLTPNIKAFLFINHLLVFIYGALLVAIFREIIRSFASREHATLLAACFVSLPLVQSQVEAINMEIPTLLFSIISIYYLTRKDFKRAAIYSIVAAMIKGYAVYICATVFVISVLYYLAQGRIRKVRPKLTWGCVALGFLILKFAVSTLTFRTEGKVKFIGFFEGWPTIRILGVTYLFILSLLVFCWVLIREKNTLGSWKKVFDKKYVEIIFFIAALGWFGLFLHSYAVAARYRLHLTPFFIGCLFISVVTFLKNERLRSKALVAAVLISCLFTYGMNYKPSDGVLESVLERSLEYRNDLKLHMRIAETMQEKYRSFLIAAPFTMAQSLAIKEMGYVQKNLDVMIYGYTCTYGGIKNFSGLQNLDIAKTVWIGLAESPMPFPYPVDPKDRVLEIIHSGRQKGIIFMGGIAIERMRRVIIALSRQGLLRSRYDGSKVTIKELDGTQAGQ